MINEWAEAVSNPWHKRIGVAMEPAVELTAMIRRGEGMNDDARAQVDDLTDGIDEPQRNLNHARDAQLLLTYDDLLQERAAWERERAKMTDELNASADELRRVKDENLYLRGQVDAYKAMLGAE